MSVYKNKMKLNKKAMLWKLLLEVIGLVLFLVFVGWLIYKATKGNLDLIKIFT